MKVLLLHGSSSDTWSLDCMLDLLLWVCSYTGMCLIRMQQMVIPWSRSHSWWIMESVIRGQISKWVWRMDLMCSWMDMVIMTILVTTLRKARLLLLHFLLRFLLRSKWWTRWMHCQRIVLSWLCLLIGICIWLELSLCLSLLTSPFCTFHLWLLCSQFIHWVGVSGNWYCISLFLWFCWMKWWSSQANMCWEERESMKAKLRLCLFWVFNKW